MAASAPPPAPAADDLVTTLELRIQCRDLANLDRISKSDPMVVVYAQKDPPSTEFFEIARTEKIMNDLNPAFRTPIPIHYYFEKVQTLRFAVLDVDDHEVPVGDFRQHDYLGEVDMKVSSIAAAPGMSLELALTNTRSPNRANGFIRVTAEEETGANAVVRLQMRAHNLPKMDGMFGKADPYMVISRLRSGSADDWQPVHQTEVVKKNLNPTWAVFEIPLGAMCGGDYDRPIKFALWDWDKRGSHDYIGELTTTLNQLCSPDQDAVLEVINPKKLKKKKYRNSGILEVVSIDIVPRPSFIEFIAGGLEMNCVIAIDYTASNGHPSNPTSLHYVSPYEPNSYEKAMRAVGQVLLPYDHDQEVPTLGFGARLPDGETSFCFPVAGTSVPVAIHGLDNVMTAYRNSLQFLGLHGPTNLAPLLHAVIELVETAHISQAEQKYFVLLVMTDGEITDMSKTKAAIVQASSLPISIVIVGVGSADFSNMEMLDGDDARLSANGVYAERDIVQFVPYRDYEAADPAYLAQVVLHEIPGQVMEFFGKHGITPNPPRAVQEDYVPPPTY